MEVLGLVDIPVWVLLLVLLFTLLYLMYLGVRPQLVVTDLDLLREVMVKNFSNFVDRMCHYINRCSQLLSENIKHKTQNQEVVDVKDVFGAFTMDVIAGTAFGLETNSQTQEAEPFVFHIQQMFKRLNFGIILVHQIASSFPFLGPVFGKLGLSFFGDEHTQFLLKALDDIIESRKNDSVRDEKAADMLQMLVDAEADADAITDRAEDSDDTKTHRRMTKDEILGQGFLVLNAGYETTATTLQYLTYNLTIHPDAQQKVVDEIREKLGDAEPTYENVASLPYLDAAIHETLRLFPPVPTINRQAAETITLRGFTIPAGCGVAIPICQITHDSEYFPEPEKFMPDRFIGENRSKVPALAIELAFGYGPRQCIGMRLALLEIKFAAVRIFRHFRFLKCDETPDTIKMKTHALAIPDRPIKVRTELRGS
nr:hypothetical protein BaRGS_023980 [Batillaria attramentaria]